MTTAIADAIAVLALIGNHVHPLGIGGFLVSHPEWLSAHYCATAKELDALSHQLRGGHANERPQ